MGQALACSGRLSEGHGVQAVMVQVGHVRSLVVY